MTMQSDALVRLAVAWLAALGAGCDSGLALTGGDGLETHDVPPADGDAESGPPDGVDGRDDTDAGDGDSTEEPACPVWVVAAGPDGPRRGTRDDPHVGLRAALAARGDCGRLVLFVDPAAPPFSLDADVAVRSWEELTIEGDPGAAGPAVLDGGPAGPGLRAAGAGTLVLRRLAFRGAAGITGGCLEARTTGLVVEDTEWSGCVAAERGGAIFAYLHELLVSRSTFRSNSAGEDGGAIFINGPTEDTHLEVDACLFEDNAATSGGALYVGVSTVDVLVSGSRFVRNHAERSASAIGGYVGGTIVGNRFEANDGGYGGGAVTGNGGWPLGRISGNLFVGNRIRAAMPSGSPCCDGAGAALTVSSSYLSVLNNLFLDNRADGLPEWGVSGVGGVVLTGGWARARNNVFVDNGADFGTAHLVVTNGEVVGNIFVRGRGGAAVVGLRGEGATLDLSYNDTWQVPEPAFACDVPLGPGNVRTDPLFRDAATGDFRLADRSPCIDAGDPADEWRDPDGSRNDLGAFGGPGGDWEPLGAGEEP